MLKVYNNLFHRFPKSFSASNFVVLACRLMVLKISSKFELRRFCRTTGAIAMVTILGVDNLWTF